MKLIFLNIIFVFTSLNIYYTKLEVVCSKEELLKELEEDIMDNGKLDCLRDSLPYNKNETGEEKDLRIKANWNSDCSFETTSKLYYNKNNNITNSKGSSSGNKWVKKLQKNYGVYKGLIDADGNTYENNNPNQADMCEIIRTLIGNGIFSEINDVTNLSKDIIKYIDCPGEFESTKVCAANSNSFSDNESWYIFLDGNGITINDEPKYKVVERDPY